MVGGACGWRSVRREEFGGEMFPRSDVYKRTGFFEIFFLIKKWSDVAKPHHVSGDHGRRTRRRRLELRNYPMRSPQNSENGGKTRALAEGNSLIINSSPSYFY